MLSFVAVYSAVLYIKALQGFTLLRLLIIPINL